MSEWSRPPSSDPSPRRTWLPDVTPGPAPDREAAAATARYEDAGPLGLGGTSEVRRVVDVDLGRTLAMKVLSPRLASRSDAVAAFLAEARRTAQLEHPGIVPVHEIGHLPDGRPFFTMKEVRGRTLHALLRARDEGEDAPLRRLLEVLHRAAEAVAYAHARGVVHRDLKPENLIVGAFGEVLVLDWGIAGTAGDPGDAGSVAGTPGFVAPEVLGGSPLTPAADVFALGTILALVLGGTPWSLPPDADEELGRLVAEATAGEPEARLPDAGAFVARLTAWLEGSRRRARARELVARAREQAPVIAALRAEATAVREAAELALNALPSWAPLERKRPAWSELARAEALAEQAALAEAERDRDLHAALREAPDDAEARERLADGWVERHGEAVARHDRVRAARYEAMIGASGSERHRRWLRGKGALTLLTDVPAEVIAHPLVERDRRKVPGDGVALGRTPLRGVELDHGSWLLRVGAPAGEVRVPVRIERLQHWEDRDPAGAPHVHRLPRPGELGPDEVLVPGGRAWLGGDPLAFGPLPLRRAWVDPFVIRRFPVTEPEYLAFLEDTADDRRAPCQEPALGGFLWPRGPDGRWRLDGRDPRWPAHGVDWFGATAFAAWWARRGGAPWRLPTEVEWEKAARGADGRAFPFGDHVDAVFCCLAGSHRGPPAIQPVDAYPDDESPYGVRGLAGNVRDWVADRYERHGGPWDGARVHPLLDDDPSVSRLQRGGAWCFVEQHARAATRWWQDPTFRHTAAGFRLARSW